MLLPFSGESCNIKTDIQKIPALNSFMREFHEAGAAKGDGIVNIRKYEAFVRAVELGSLSSLRTKLLIAREVLALRSQDAGVTGAKIDVSSGKNAHYIPAVLPTVTPVPTATPTVAPSATPGA